MLTSSHDDAGSRERAAKRRAAGGAMNPKKIAELQTAVVGNEVLVHDTLHGKVHVLNAVAARILDLCDGETAPATIASRLGGEYGADPSLVERDVDAALQQFASLRLLESANP
jgi:PqqD family protein of HPr-rel-A system